MAYSNWGAVVVSRKAGEAEWQTRDDRIDVPTHGLAEADVLAIQVGARSTGFNDRYICTLLNARARGEEEEPDWYMSTKHAVLGGQRVRLCGYKDQVELWWDREQFTMPGNLTEGRLTIEDFGDNRINQFGDVQYKVRWCHLDDPHRIALHLEDPDGTVWVGCAGYGFSGDELDLTPLEETVRSWKS